MNTAGSKRPRESDAPIPLDTADVAIGGEAAVNDAESTTVPSSSASRKKAKTDASADGGDVAGMNGGPAGDDTPSTFPTSVDVEKSATMDTAAESSAAAAKPAPRRAQRKSALAAKNKIIAAEATVDETDEDVFVKKKVDNNNAAPSSSTAEQQAIAGTTAPAANAKAAASAPTTISTKLVPPPVVQRSRGRGGDRIPEGQTPPTVSASAAAALAALHPQDPNNPYMLPYPHMSMMHPAMIPPNPYLPPPPPGSYPMFSPGMMPGPGGYPMIPPGFQIPGQQAQQQPGQEGANTSGDSGNGDGGEQQKEGEQKESGASGLAEGGATGEGQSNETNANSGDQAKNTNGDATAGTAAQPQPQPPHHPYAYVYPPPGFAGHVMPAPEYLPNPNDPNAPQHHHHVGVHPHHHPHPLPHMQMIPPMTHHAVPNPTGTHHPPHPALHQTHHHPGMASTMQLTLPLAVTDSALPSHLDALIRAPDSLTVTYTEVPDGAYLLRSDFGEPYPKQLEPPRKVTEIRCLFCKRHYSGPNARGMWRRHVTGKHDFAFERKPGGGGGGSGHGGSRVGGRSAPIVMDEDDDEGGGGGDGGASGADVGNTTMNSGEGPDGQGGMGGMNLDGIIGMGGLMSMNGLPVPGASTGQPQQQPGGHNPAMHFGPVPILHPPLGSIPPHPHSGLDNPNKKRSGGVGAGNGGGGVVPRVHPLLTKEERIERARASKRHYAMKRRALEKMKQGGIPKGARLENGVFILTDGTQIPADPSVEYKDLSVKPGGGLSAVHGGTVGGDDDDEDDEFGSGSGVKGKGKKKGRGRASRTSKKEIADDDDEGDEDDDDGHIGDESGVLGDVNMDHPGDGDTSMSMGDLALMGHHGLVQMDGGQMNMIAGGGPGISVDMDPWGDPNAAAAMYQQHQHQEQVKAAAAAASGGLQGKLAEIPIVNRGGYKLSPVPQSSMQDANANTDPNEGFTAPASEDLTATAPPVAAATKPAPRRGGRRSAATAAPIDDEEHDDGNAETSRAGLRRVGLRTRGEKKDIAPVFPPDNTSTVESAVTSATVGGGTSTALPPGIIPPGEDEPERTFCYCNDVEYGNMIGCDNGPNCSREWFHLACTDITGPIPTRWFCRDCRLKIAEQDGPAPADASMETGESSVPSAVVAPSQEAAAPTQEEGGRPRRRTTRISKVTAPPVIEAPAIRAPAKKAAAPGGKKRGRKSKAGAEKPAAGEDEIDELADDGPIDDIGGAPAAEGQAGANDVESEDEQPANVVASGSAPTAAHETPVGKPISSAKAAESPRSRRSTRGHPQVEA
ncbi:Histone acetyltransferase complex subunit [Tulasnella sp. JGI-2019a]|nr:Histone acetyltransferase complex subunit [Tulasnella sp. JGI-2019a]KAG9002331.1 Histone acetyltransferase complex subunit [Tulasnella sp. JGI-2019a]